MRESSISNRREIARSLFETRSIVGFLIYDDSYYENDNFEILTEFIKVASNEVISFQEIVKKFDFQELRQYSCISQILSNPRIKEPIIASLNKNPPISLFLEEPYLIFFYTIYLNNTLHKIINDIIKI